MKLYMFFLLTITITFLFYPKSASVSVKDDVHSLPFVALYREHKTLHLVDDYFHLIQSINLEPMVHHMHDVTQSFALVRNKYNFSNNTRVADNSDLENKLKLLLEHLAQNLEAGMMMLPHKSDCLLRSKRSIGIDQEPVNTVALFPQVGRLFSWVTGSLSADAGRYINENYNNIKRLTKMSVRFAQMFNATLSIEKKHGDQIKHIKQEVKILNHKLNEKMDMLERKINYEGFLDNLIIIIVDLQRTVDLIFQHTDNIELNQMGPLSRDPVFLKAVSKLMNAGSVQSKANVLYLMKIGSKIDVEACDFHISITYKFPVLRNPDFTPWKTISVPKLINDKYYQLSHIPYMIAYHEQVYTFTEQEYRDCEHKNRFMFCKTPTHVEELLDSCIYGIMNHIPWQTLAKKCPLSYVKDPLSFIEFTDSHLIYFNTKNQMATLLCPDSHPEKNAKPMWLEGAGIITVPPGCKVQYGNKRTFTMGHIQREAEIQFEMNDKIWQLNMSRILPLLHVNNLENDSLVYDTSAEEDLIKQGISDTWNLLENMQFTPSGVTYTLFSLILYTAIATALLIFVMCMICYPGYAIRCRQKCCCESKHNIEIEAPN